MKEKKQLITFFLKSGRTYEILLEDDAVSEMEQVRTMFSNPNTYVAKVWLGWRDGVVLTIPMWEVEMVDVVDVNFEINIDQKLSKVTNVGIGVIQFNHDQNRKNSEGHAQGAGIPSGVAQQNPMGQN